MAKKKAKQETSAEPSAQQRYSNRFDTMFKSLMRLSAVTIIRFINALFGTHWPDACMVSYPSTEFHYRRGKKQTQIRNITDCVIRISETIGGSERVEDHDYIMEIQSSRDTGIVVRIFEYSLGSAILRRLTDQATWRDELREEGLVRVNTIIFPEARILHLAKPSPVAEVLLFNFGTQGVFEYRVEVLRLLEQSIADIENAHLTILLPFYTLLLRSEVEHSTSKTCKPLAQSLKQLHYELTAAIGRGTARGEMTQEDMVTVLDHMEELLTTICEPYKGFKEVTEMVNGSYLTRRQKEVLQERERGKQELKQELQRVEQGLQRSLQEMGLSPEQIKLAWSKANPTGSVS